MPKRRSAKYDPSESLLETLPDRIPVMPIKSTVLFPTGATGLQVGFAPNVEVLTRYRDPNLVVALVHSNEEEMPIDASSLERIGVAARVLNRLNLPGGTVQTTMQGLIRIHLEDVRLVKGHYTGYPRLVEEVAAEAEEASGIIERILTTLGGIGASVNRLAEVPKILRGNLGDPGRFADLVATLAHFQVDDKDGVLQRLDVAERLRFVESRLEAEWERLKERKDVAAETRGESDGQEAGPATERARSLRKRIATLQAELGEIDPAERQSLELIRRIDNTQLPARVASIARQEAERLRAVHPTSADANEIRGYLDTVLDIPWAGRVEDAEIDLNRVRTELDSGHVGLDEVKRKILEILSVARLRGDVKGPIPCIVGPPDVGKASLAAAIARGLGRPLARLQLGGRGESQLIGVRRPRNGARAGKIISAYRDVDVRDPVFLFEEIDQAGLGSVEGDPIEALEVVLDPTTRAEFVDRYLDVPFDLSETLFVATANDFYRIPRSLREFLIEIRIAGYTPEEKVEIAREKTLPEIVGEHGLSEEEVEVSEDTLVFLIRGYARDSGLGNLRRAIGAVMRYIAHDKTCGGGPRWEVTPALVEEILGSPRYPSTEAESAPEVGIVTGLAWTASGGELMLIEALKMPGTGRLIITGMLGDVMKESVNAAYSYVRSRSEMLGIPTDVFPSHDLHIHFPLGATPKDGPSAGAAVTLAVASSLSDQRVRHDIALTGEVTLRGKILEVGGVKEKILAAYRAGIREVIMPAGNKRDLRDVPDDVRHGMEYHFVTQIDEVFALALVGKAASGGKTPTIVAEPVKEEGAGKTGLGERNGTENPAKPPKAAARKPRKRKSVG